MESGLLTVLAVLLVCSPAVAFLGSNFQPLHFGYQQPVYGVVPVKRGGCARQTLAILLFIDRGLMS